MKNTISSEYSSGSLIERVRAMDKQAWGVFVEIYGPLIHGWCLQSGLNPTDAADMVQEVFAVVIKSIHRFSKSPNGTFRGWLWMITRNRICDFFRAQPSRAIPTGGTDLQIQMRQIADPINVFDDEATEDPTSPNQSANLMQRALDAIENDFAPITWRAFWRSVVQGDKTSTIATDLGMSTNSVRQAKSRVLRRLRQLLSET